MSAIYQRARPVSWDELVGQEHVRGVLQATLAAGKLGHAYLFSGPRGVGKTTSARLIAMAANCEGEGARPCGVCAPCREVQAGSHPDVLEIDAASNNSVDDVRELREKVGLAPMRGGRKVYILDEAHMMSKAAFNALLKTLEEPPAHVIFILATTEADKILPTILSRCQHYRFRRLSPEEIAGKLGRLAAHEGVSADEDALLLLGRLADGAMRDGESLLERLLAGGERVTVGAVEAALGLPPAAEMDALAGALLAGDSADMLARARALYAAGHAARGVVSGVVAALSRRLLAGDSGRALLRTLAALDAQDARFVRSGDLLSLELALVHGLLAAGEGSGDGGAAPAAPGAPLSGTPTPGAGAQLERRLAALEAALARGSAPVSTPPAPTAPTPAARAPVAVTVTPASAPAAAGDAEAGWNDVLRRANMQLRAFLRPARAELTGGVLTVTYGEQHGFHAGQCAQHLNALAALVREVFGDVGLRLSGPGVERQVPGGAGAEGPASPPVAAAASDPPAPVPVRSGRPPPAPPRSRSADFFEGSGDPASSAPGPAPEPEPLSQEPEWEDIPFEALGEPPAAPEPARQAAPAPPPKRSPSPPAVQGDDARAHPMFDQISRHLPGRAVGSGKRRRPQGEAEEPEE